MPGSCLCESQFLVQDAAITIDHRDPDPVAEADGETGAAGVLIGAVFHRAAHHAGPHVTTKRRGCQTEALGK